MGLLWGPRGRSHIPPHETASLQMGNLSGCFLPKMSWLRGGNLGPKFRPQDCPVPEFCLALGCLPSLVSSVRAGGPLSGILGGGTRQPVSAWSPGIEPFLTSSPVLLQKRTMMSGF